jgi:hypothetical protein
MPRDVVEQLQMMDVHSTEFSAESPSGRNLAAAIGLRHREK